MPRVRFLTDHAVALDGVHVSTFAAGDELDVPDELAEHWTEHGIAEPADQPATTPRRRGRGHTPKRETT